MKLISRLAALALAAAFLGQVQAIDWPQWRGPDRDGVSKEKGLLQKWPEGGPKRVWLSDKTGIGYGGPAIAEGRLYIMGAQGPMEFLMAYDAEKGEQLWSTEIGVLLRNNWGDGPRGTPSVVGERVYALGAQGTLICVNARDGSLVWKKTMRELGGEVPNWGYTESVLVRNGRVYCTPGGPQGTIAALNADTGERIWQTSEFTDPAHYSSIISVEHRGTRQLIQLTEKFVTGVEEESGKVLWQSPWPGRTAVIPTPIYHDGFVYVTTGYGVGCKLVEIRDNNPRDVYENKVMKNHHGGVVRIGDHLYGHSDQVGWVCQDFKTGEEVWAERDKLGKGAVVSAGGRLYCLEEDSGTVALLEQTAEGYREHGRFKLDPQTTQRASRGKVWTHPVVSNGKLYLRDQELLFCFDVSGGN